MEKDSWVGVTYFYNWNYGANSNVCNSRIQNRSIDLLGKPENETHEPNEKSSRSSEESERMVL